MYKIAIFASGSGSNAQRIAEYFRDSRQVEISRIFCNRKDAFVLERAQKIGIPAVLFGAKEFYETSEILDLLIKDKTDLIVLAGFLWFVPENILKAFSNRVINIHPALLPKFGGKGMHGKAVHEAVIHNREKESGITIHYVNEKYDDGEIIFQARCPVERDDTAESLAQKIHHLEYQHFPVVIDKLIRSFS